MKTVSRFFFNTLFVAMASSFLSTLTPSSTFAHCDTMDGPIIIEALAALEKGDVTPVLKWVKKENEEEIISLFKEVATVRSKYPDARKIAERYFLETLVRLHRAGEGAPFTGIKPAGSIEPAIAAADKAIVDGSVDELAKEIGHAAEEAIKQRFIRLMEAKKHINESVEAGREYVEAYVEYVHFIEGLHQTIAGGATHHEHEGE